MNYNTENISFMKRMMRENKIRTQLFVNILIIVLLFHLCPCKSFYLVIFKNVLILFYNALLNFFLILKRQLIWGQTDILVLLTHVLNDLLHLLIVSLSGGCGGGGSGGGSCCCGRCCCAEQSRLRC